MEDDARAGAVIALAQATDAALYGGKAANLAIAAGHDLPVPPAVALPWPLVARMAEGDEDARRLVEAACRPLGGPLVVRSSALGEDSAHTSFAGQHLSVVNVADADGVGQAVTSVWESARTASAAAYRERMGVAAMPRVGVIVQSLVDAEVAGVLFDGNPLTGADEVVIESAWGLGEAVVAGIVTPDLFRLGLTGEVRERSLGDKHVELRPAPDGGTAAHPVAAERARAPSLSEEQLGELFRLARRCRDVFGGSQDLEWAYEGETLWLLQRRPVTATVRH